MTVSYRTSMTDNWQHLKYIFTRTIMGRCLLVFVLVTPLASLVGFYHGVSLHHTSPLHHAAPSPRFDHLMAIVSLIMVATIYILFLFSGLVGLYLRTLIAPNATVTIDAETFSLNTFMTAKARWKLFSTVAEEADYFCFAGWMQAFLVPKRAFHTSAEACAFFDAASAYWRKAKGVALLPAPDVSGVWPPAPRAGDSQELGGTPKG